MFQQMISSLSSRWHGWKWILISNVNQAGRKSNWPFIWNTVIGTTYSRILLLLFFFVFRHFWWYILFSKLFLPTQGNFSPYLWKSNAGKVFDIASSKPGSHKHKIKHKYKKKKHFPSAFSCFCFAYFTSR